MSIPFGFVAQEPNCLQLTDFEYYYPRSEWYLGTSIGSQNKGETVDETLRRLRLKEQAQKDLVSTILIDIKSVTESDIWDHVDYTTSEFEEIMRESFSSETILTSKLNGIHGMSTQWYVKDGDVIVLARVNKLELKKYYKNKLSVIYDEIQSKIHIVNYLISEGKNLKAKEEILKVQETLSQSNDDYNWLLLVGYDDDAIRVLFKKKNELASQIEKTRLNILNTASVFMQCEGNILSLSCSVLSDAVKTRLCEQSCSLVDSPNEADWWIYMKTNAELDLSHKNAERYFVKIIVTTTITNSKTHQIYTLINWETDSSLRSSGNYLLVVNKILQRENLAEEIKKDIYEIIKSV